MGPALLQRPGGALPDLLRVCPTAAHVDSQQVRPGLRLVIRCAIDRCLFTGLGADELDHFQDSPLMRVKGTKCQRLVRGGQLSFQDFIMDLKATVKIMLPWILSIYSIPNLNRIIF